MTTFPGGYINTKRKYKNIMLSDCCERDKLMLIVIENDIEYS